MNAPRLLYGALALAVTVTACHRQPSRAEVQQTATDTADKVKTESVKARDQLADVWLNTKIHSKFIADRDINASDIGVSAKNGVVTLKGRVLNVPMRDLAVAIARNTDGVTQVVDQLAVEIAGPAPAPGPTAGAIATSGTAEAPTVAPSDDARITSSIQSRYFLDDRIKGRHIAVTSTAGVVALNGEVGDETERAQALLLARTTDGVTRVEDGLTIATAPVANPPVADAPVVAPPSATSASDSDEALTGRVKSELSSHARVKGAPLEVTARNGVVLLQGTVATSADKQHALTLARKTNGVTQVVDRIRVEPQARKATKPTKARK